MKKVAAQSVVLILGLFITALALTSPDSASAGDDAARMKTGSYALSILDSGLTKRSAQSSVVTKLAQQCARSGEYCNYEACPGGEGGCQSDCCPGLTCTLEPAQRGATGWVGCQ